MTRTPANDNIPRPASFDALLAKYDGFIRAKCAAYPDAEDLYQSVLLRALTRWKQYRPNGKFMSWIGYQIKSQYHEPQRRAKRGEKYPYYAPRVATDATQEHAADVARAVAGLPTNEREVISLLAVGFDGGEVGRFRGISRQRVFQIAERARERLVAANDNGRAGKVAV